jgi:hypothetical protein
MTTFDATLLGRGWLSVAIASSKDAERPALHRTVYVEHFPEGVRLVATDSYILLRAWVPNVGHENDPEPGLDEVPVSTAIAIDSDARAVGFLKYALKRAREAAQYHESVEVTLNLGVVDRTASVGTPSFGGMESRWVVLEMADVEKVKLLCCEGVWPNWRLLGANYAPEKTETVALAPDRLVQVAKLAKVNDAMIGWEFGGSMKVARIDVLESEPHVQGLVMPCRWDVATNEPRVESEAKAAPDLDVPDDLSGMDGNE